ncbi:3973_t:CDS:2, partial [Racocetra persica]
QHIAKLEAKNTIIPELKKRVAKLETKNTKILELKKKIVEVETRLVILEQRLLQNDNTPNNSASNDNTSNFNLVTDKVVKLKSNNKKLIDQSIRKQIYNEMKPYLSGVSDKYLYIITYKARKINKLFGYKYDSVNLKKNKNIEQIKSKTITDQSHIDKIFETIATTSTYNSDDIFRRRRDNELIEDDSKKSEKNEARIEKEKQNKISSNIVTLAKADNYDDVNSKEKIPDESNNDRYSECGRYNEY